MRALVAIMDAARSGQIMSPGRLGEELGLTSASVTALLDRLEQAGHIHRIRDQHDRRRVTLEIDQQALGAEFFGPLNTQLLKAMDEVSQADLEVVGRFLEAMTDVIMTNRRTPTGNQQLTNP
jgi:DNA-binding MarR family transcriptional regulator